MTLYTSQKLVKHEEKGTTKRKMIKWFGIIILDTRFEFIDRASLWSTVSQSKYRSAPAFGKNPVCICTVLMCCGGMFDGAINQICKMRVRAMRLIGGNLLKTSFLILMCIANSYSLLWISCVLISPYHSDTDRVVIGLIWVCQCMWK